MFVKMLVWTGCLVLTTSILSAQDGGALSETKPVITIDPQEKSDEVSPRKSVPNNQVEAVLGTWFFQFETPFGIQDYQLDVALDEGNVTAKAVVQTGQQERKLELTDVKIEEDKISFAEVRQFGERTMRIAYSGKLENKTLLLTRSFGQQVGQEAVASRKRPAARPKKDTKPIVEVKVDRIIKDAFEDMFLIGMAGDLPSRYSEPELELAGKHFAAITPENCMKPERIHPDEERWQFGSADAVVRWAQQNNMTAHGHTLVWHQQTPTWFFAGDDKEVIKQRMQDHISTLVGRYKGKLQSWDVVNEAINDGGNSKTGETENLRDSKWMQTLGPEFLTLAFQYAHQADPDAVLYYNDYNIESGPKHQSSLVLLKRLLDDGAPIHAVGIQGHWRTGQVPYEDINNAISDYASLGLKVGITELDVTIRGSSGGQFGRGGFGRRRSRNAAPITVDDLNEQAEAYAKLFAIFKKHEAVIERVTFWGLNDRRTWRWGQHPLLFDSNNHVKPAYAAIVKLSKSSSGN